MGHPPWVYMRIDPMLVPVFRRFNKLFQVEWARNLDGGEKVPRFLKKAGNF